MNVNGNVFMAIFCTNAYSTCKVNYVFSMFEWSELMEFGNFLVKVEVNETEAVCISPYGSEKVCWARGAQASEKWQVTPLKLLSRFRRQKLFFCNCTKVSKTESATILSISMDTSIYWPHTKPILTQKFC